MSKVKATKQGKPIEVVKVKCRTCGTSQDVKKGLTEAHCLVCDLKLDLPQT
jgi:ribosomal protein S27E